MEKPFISKEAPVRSEQEVNAVVNDAITEVVEAFGDEMTDRDKQMLEGVAGEISPSPVDRVAYLLDTRKSAGISEQYPQYINNVFQTLREKLTPAEKEKFRTWSAARTLLDDIEIK